MTEGWGRWAEDETVGKALLVAGVVMLLVQVLPWSAVSFLVKLWPLALIVIGIRMVLASGRKERSNGGS